VHPDTGDRLDPGGPVLQVRRAAGRATTRTAWLWSRHSFSFGRHFDPANLSFGLLLAANEEVLQPGAGFPEHPHRDIEILTWVLAGELVHEDSTGRHAMVGPGVAQLVSAGSGVVHEERNASAVSPVHFVQMWLPPAVTGLPPAYAQLDVSAELEAGGLVALASAGAGGTALPLRQPDATLYAGRLTRGWPVSLPEAPYVHLYVARGAVHLEGAGPLEAGDAARLTGAGAPLLTAHESAEVLVWAMHAALGR